LIRVRNVKSLAVSLKQLCSTECERAGARSYHQVDFRRLRERIVALVPSPLNHVPAYPAWGGRTLRWLVSSPLSPCSISSFHPPVKEGPENRSKSVVAFPPSPLLSLLGAHASKYLKRVGLLSMSRGLPKIGRSVLPEALRKKSIHRTGKAESEGYCAAGEDLTRQK